MKAKAKVFLTYMLILFLLLIYGGAFAQIQVAQFNAGWNSANEVAWVNDLEDCKTISYVDISKQADLSFKMLATREEVQEEINNQLMSDF